MYSFSLCFSDKYSRRVRDLHLLKKLSAVLDQVKENEGSFSLFVSVYHNVLCGHAKMIVRIKLLSYFL